MTTLGALVNAILGFFVFYVQFSFFKGDHKENGEYYAWLKKLLGITGLYWGLLYSYVFLADLGVLPTIDPIFFGIIFIRPANTLWLGIVAGAGYMRLLTNRRVYLLREKNKIQNEQGVL